MHIYTANCILVVHLYISRDELLFNVYSVIGHGKKYVSSIFYFTLFYGF